MKSNKTSEKKYTKDGHSFCYQCKYFYSEKMNHYPEAHCDFEIFKSCEGRLKAVDLGEEYRR